MKPRLFLITLACLAACTVPLALASPGDVEKKTEHRANPAVTPGLIKWHTDFDAACQASKKSGKPVLLFQMLGKLDQEFC